LHEMEGSGGEIGASRGSGWLCSIGGG
jgi:hypothetical protein